MDFQETPADVAFRNEVRQFVATNLPQAIRDRVLGFRRVPREDYVNWQRILYARGWGAPGWPVEFGGTGWNARQRTIFEEECFEAGAPRQIPFGLSMIGPVLMKFGTAAQQQQYLPKIISMDDWWCQGYSEPGAGSDLAALKTRAERVDDVYVINGQKTWTSFAHYANRIFCLVRTSAAGKPQEGISFLFMDMDTPGLSVRSIKTLDQGADVNEVFLDNVRVPRDHLIGEPGKGWTYAKYLLEKERTASAFLYFNRHRFEMAKDIARRRIVDGKPLIAHPAFARKLARVEADLDALNWSVLRILAGEKNRHDLNAVVSALKIRGSEMQQRVTTLQTDGLAHFGARYFERGAEHTEGDLGGWDEFAVGPMSLFLFERASTIYGGAREVQKNIIAKTAFGF